MTRGHCPFPIGHLSYVIANPSVAVILGPSLIVILIPSLLVILSPDAIGTKNLTPIRVNPRWQSHAPLLGQTTFLGSPQPAEESLDIAGRGDI